MKKRSRRNISGVIGSLLAAALLFAFPSPTQADYYDWYGNYYDDFGNMYTAYGYYDIYGYFHEYGVAAAEPVYSADGLRATDPNGFYQYVPLFYPADVITEDVSVKEADLPVACIFQNPEMPNGCEAVATTTVLSYLGFAVDKMQIGMRYFTYEEPQLDWRNFYIGNPFDYTGLGCYSNAVTDAANAYLLQQETTLRAFNYTNYPFEELLNQVAIGHPVIIWTTGFMYEPYYGIVRNINGTDIRWITREHCLVLCGYDIENKIVKVADPMAGNVTYDLDMFKKRFTQMGSQAVIIKEIQEQFEADKDILVWPFYDKYLPKDQYVRGCKGFDGVFESD